MRFRLGGAWSLVAVLAATAVAGCGGGPTQSAATVVFTGTVEPIAHGSVTARQVSAGETAFGLQLLGRVCAGSPTANAVVSPASAAQALGMLDAGASGATRAAVSRVLHLPVWSPSLVAAMHDQTAAVGGADQVAVSNHVFEQHGVTPSRQTLNDLRTAFGADLRTVDFARHATAATAAINQTVSEDTHGLIPRLFDNPLDASTQTVLADAIYLRARWLTRFAPAEPAPFRTAAGRTVNTPTMDGTDLQAPLRSTRGWQSVTLPYQGHRLQAVALLPPASTAGCPTPSPATLHALIDGASSHSVGVQLPRLHLAQTLDLTGTLASLGLPQDGDYTGLGATDSHVSAVVQKVVMDVTETGTRAAAATGVAVATSEVQSIQPLLSFDRPFLFLIEDTATESPLFLTYITDPA